MSFNRRAKLFVPWIPVSPVSDKGYTRSEAGLVVPREYYRAEPVDDPIKPIEQNFEVNLVEPLVGWKGWEIEHCSTRACSEPPYPTVIVSSYNRAIWHPLKPFEAKCDDNCSITRIPAEHHTCGIYALDAFDPEEGASCYEVYGQVYGWGRYIRGNNGWRSQFAYPKSFHLKFGAQEDILNALRAYKVPIYILKEVEIYNPQTDESEAEEDRYYEYWQDEANWDLGASEAPDSIKAEYSDYTNEDFGPDSSEEDD